MKQLLRSADEVVAQIRPACRAVSPWVFMLTFRRAPRLHQNRQPCPQMVRSHERAEDAAQAAAVEPAGEGLCCCRPRDGGVRRCLDQFGPPIGHHRRSRIRVVDSRRVDDDPVCTVQRLSSWRLHLGARELSPWREYRSRSGSWRGDARAGQQTGSRPGKQTLLLSSSWFPDPRCSPIPCHFLNESAATASAARCPTRGFRRRIVGNLSLLCSCFIPPDWVGLVTLVAVSCKEFRVCKLGTAGRHVWVVSDIPMVKITKQVPVHSIRIYWYDDRSGT